MPVRSGQKNPAVRLVQGPGKVLQEENSRTVLTITTTTNEARKVPQFLAAFTATLGALSAGTFFSWTSGIQDHIIIDGKKVDTDTFSWIASIFHLSAFVGCLFAGMAANRLGRQRSLLLLAPPLFVSWLLLSLNTMLVCLVLGRILGGMAVGAVSVVAGMYVSEIAEPSVRGTLGSFFQLQITVGILVGYVVGLLHDPAHIAYVNLVLPALYGALFWNMPESPAFLLSRGQSERAHEALQWLRGPEYDVSGEVAAIRHSIMEAQRTKASIKDLLRSRATVKGMVVALGLMACQQLSGINAVICYTAEIFADSGSSITGEESSIIVGIVQVASTFMSMLLVDRAGRRVLLLLSSSVMTVCLAMLGVFFHLKDAGHDMSNITWLPLVTVAVLIVVFSLGLGPLPWCVVSEIFSPSSKGTASSIACGANWIMAFTVTKFFTNLVDIVHQGGAFFTFASIGVLGTLFIALVVPETKGKTLEEILAELTGVKSFPHTGVAVAIEEEEGEDETNRTSFPL